MNIAIIGSGHVGSALAECMVSSGHRVTVTARRPEHARLLAERVGARHADSNAEAVEGADIVVLAVPPGAVPTVVDEIGSLLDGRILIDVTNPLNEDLTALSSERSGAEDIQDMVPNASVVKALNTVLSVHQAHPEIDGQKLDGLFAGDDREAKQKVWGLLAGMGYRPIDAGPLPLARALEEMALLNMRLNATNRWAWQTEWKLVGPTTV